jgi:predicted methyltransferase
MTRHTVTMLLLVLGGSAAALAQQPQHGRLFPPENLGLLEGPDREVWQRPDQVMDALRIADGSVVADLGAGSGWFTIRLARRVGPNGKVYAEDVQREMIDAIDRRRKREGLRNVQPVLGKQSDPQLPPGRLDAALIVDSYYEMEEPVALLRNLAKSLKLATPSKPGGRIGIVNYTKAGFGPGPPLDERVDPSIVIADAEAAGLRVVARPDFLPFQYMLVLERADPRAR